MSAPTRAHLRMLKRIGRYLLAKPRVAVQYKWQYEQTYLEAIGDSDHAQCPVTRKNTNGGIIRVGQHSLTAWSTTQSVPALSTGESEYYAMVKTAAEGLGVQSGIFDLGTDLELRTWSDSSAAIGVANRQGTGSKLKHVESRYFWLQYAVKAQRLKIMKEKGTENSSDMMTKYLAWPVLEKLMGLAGMVILKGRHAKTP